MKILARLWRDERGGVSGIAMILIYTIVALGVTVGLVTLRDQIVQEFGDLAVALDSLSQSWSVAGGVEGAGKFTDTPLFTPPADPPDAEPAGIDIQCTPTPESP